MERSSQFRNSAVSTTVMNGLQHSSLYPDPVWATTATEEQHREPGRVRQSRARNR